jgi:hypothetical protein
MSSGKKSGLGRRTDASAVRLVPTGIQYRSLREVGRRTEAAIRKAVGAELLRSLRQGQSTDSEAPTPA